MNAEDAFNNSEDKEIFTMEKHFKIRKDLSMEYAGRTLYRIEATKDLPKHGVKKGDLGGWIEKEENLQDNAWIADEAKVFDNAKACGNAKVYDEAEVYGCSKVFDNAKVYNAAIIRDNAEIYGDAKVCRKTEIYDNALVFGNALVYGDARIYGNAKVCGNAEVHGYAWICDNAQIYGNAEVYGGALISEDARVCGNAEVGGNTAVIGDIIRHQNDCKNIIGERYNITITPKYIKIGCQHHTKEEWWKFTDREILEMDGKDGLKWWTKWKPLLKGICEDE
jgi:carbonic anhydrase/acetyltransferase-like protein (isoleucine patch superfamily)